MNVALMGGVGAGGTFRVGVGEIVLTVVADGTFMAPLAETFAANADTEEAYGELQKRFLPAGEPGPAAVNCVLIQAPDATLLVDAGSADALGPSAGHAGRHLRGFGLKPGDIDAVVLTHLHGDHANGIVAEENADLLGGVDVLMTGAEREFWSGGPSLSEALMDDGTREGLRENAASVLGRLGSRVKSVSSEERLAEGVRLFAIPGHTPGHVGVEVESGGERVLWVTDLLHVPAMQFAHPEWASVFDTDPALAASSRRSMLERISDEGVLVAGTHIPFPSTGHVRREGGGFAFEPAVWQF